MTNNSIQNMSEIAYNKQDIYKFKNEGYGSDYENIENSTFFENFTIERRSKETKYYIKIKITNNYSLEYKIHSFANPQGFGAEWQNTLLYFSIANWGIR